MAQAVLKSPIPNAPSWWQRGRSSGQLLLIVCRELLALVSLMAGLGLGLLALAERVGPFAGF